MTIWQLFDNFIVDTLLSKFTDKPLSTFYVGIYLALLSAIAFFYYDRVVIKAYRISLITLFLIIGICILYWHHRISESKYIFYPLLENKSSSISLKQLDPLFVFFAVLGLLLLTNHFRFLSYPENSTFLSQDQPIDDAKADEFNRKGFFADLVAELKKISFDSTKGFSIGINSTWGFGKTSLLKIIKNGFKNTDNIVCIEYNPWLSVNKHSLTYDFFIMIENELSQHIETSNLVSQYGQRISKIDHDKNPLKWLSGLFEDEKSLHERFEEIGELIKKTNKRFFIIVDDLDRLDNSEAFEVLRLVRNTGNFPRLNFIVAYDKEYLNHALRNNKIYRPNQYLEKIFDLEIVLPKIEGQIILKVLLNAFNEGLEKMVLIPDEKRALLDQLSNLIFNSNNTNSTKILAVNALLLDIFKSKRDVIKFVNAVLLMLTINKDKIYLPDLFIIEIIKLKAPYLYELLASGDKYLDLTESDGMKRYKLHEKAMNNADDLELIMNSQRRGLFNIRDKISDERFKNLIETLFEQPILSDYKSRHAINLGDNFESYFIYNRPAGSFGFDQLDDLIYENE